MPPLFITANELSPMPLKCVIKLRCVRTYLIPDRVATNSIKSRECLFHDKEVFPPEILALKGSSMAFRIAIRKQQFHNMHNAFGVMQILNDPALVDAHCPELLEDSENEYNDKQLLDAEDDEEVILWNFM
nr:replication protein A 70 kDa DNA-binding subunit D-like [Ipomoea batatas]